MSTGQAPSGRGKGRGFRGAQRGGAGAAGGPAREQAQAQAQAQAQGYGQAVRGQGPARGREWGYQSARGGARGTGRSEPRQGNVNATASYAERKAQDAFFVQVMNYLIANRAFEQEGNKKPIIQSIGKNIIHKTDLTREQRLESHISTILLKKYEGTEFQASIYRGDNKKVIIVSSNQSDVNNRVRAEIKTGKDLKDLALETWQEEKDENRRFKSRLQRHAAKAWHSLEGFEEADVVSVPDEYAPGKHAELRIQAYIDAMNKKTDVALRLNGASTPSGVKIPCLACYTVFAHSGMTLSYLPGALFINYKSTLLPFEIAMPKTYSEQDVKRVGNLILAKIDPILEDVKKTSGTMMGKWESNLRPNSESDMTGDEMTDMKSAASSRRKKLTKTASR